MRLATISILVWAFLAVPALCIGGVLLHACQCADVGDCAHEVACAEDPCGDLVVRPDSSDGVDDAGPRVVEKLPSFSEATLKQPIAATSHPSSLPFPGQNLSLPPSDLPLLI